MRRFQGVAAVLFASAAGCGKTTALTDAFGGDATRIDSGTTVDATPAPVTVITKSRSSSTSPPGTLVAGVSVYAAQPSGTAGPSGQTDATGKVVLDGVEAGASITAVYQVDATDAQLVTVLGVKPGDTITLGDQYGVAPPGGNTGTLNVTFPSYTGATNYQVFSPCNSISTNGSPVALAENCTLATAGLLLVALDDGGNVLASGIIKNAPYTDGQTAALTAWTAAPTGGFGLSISGLIADVYEVDALASMEVDGVTNFARSAYVDPVTGGAASFSIPVPIGGDRTFAQARLYRNGYGQQETYTSVGPTATSATLPAPGLPWLGARQLDATGQTVAWLQLGTGSYDAAFATMQWNHYDATSDTTINYRWSVLVPPGQSSFQWGTPIAALAPYVPATTDIFQSFYVQLIDLADATSYDEVRAVPEWQWQSPGNVTEDGEVPGVSSVAYGAEGSTPTGSVRPQQSKRVSRPAHAH